MYNCNVRTFYTIKVYLGYIYGYYACIYVARHIFLEPIKFLNCWNRKKAEK